MKPIVIESPYAGDVEANLRYLDQCIRDCLRRDETPYASHKMLITALDDDDPSQRAQGMLAGLGMAGTIGRVAFYVDLGWSNGMLAARAHYENIGVTWWTRELGAPQ